MPEDRLTISSTARMHPDEVARHTFGTVRRGFDPAEVRSFLEHVARELMAAADREQELRRAVAEADHRAAHPVLDDATLTSALGQETARVLQSAHDAAAELTARAEHDAARVLDAARQEAEELQRNTQERAGEQTAQSEGAAAELRRRAQEDAASMVETAKVEAEALMEQARAECRAMVTEAQELRARCWPTSRAVAGCSTARSSSCGPGVSDWPRPSATCATPSTGSPTSFSGPRTRPGWPPRPPAGRRPTRTSVT